jgi:hypothetical protein
MKKRFIILSTLVAIAVITPATHNVGVHVDIEPKKPKVVQTNDGREESQQGNGNEVCQGRVELG